MESSTLSPPLFITSFLSFTYFPLFIFFLILLSFPTSFIYFITHFLLYFLFFFTFFFFFFLYFFSTFLSFFTLLSLPSQNRPHLQIFQIPTLELYIFLKHFLNHLTTLRFGHFHGVSVLRLVLSLK